MGDRSSRIVEVDDVVLDLDAAELRKSGSVVEVEPQVFDLIAYLAHNAGRVVSRDEIIDAVWRGRIVSDSAISTRINAARRALGDDGKTQRFIKTVHGRGFRFADGVAAGPAPEPETAAHTTNKPSIAVMPFASPSGDPDQEIFADGMSEDIITALTRFRSVFVIARNSTFAYKGRSPDVREIARDLGVRYVLKGSVRPAGERLRINAQLLDAATGNHHWAERYDRQIEDIFNIQDEVTEAIVSAIAPEIGDAERRRAQRKPPDSLDAWDLHQRGLADFYASTEERLRSAISQFDRVNELDPTFAPAFAMAAGARWRYVMHFEPDDRGKYLTEALEKAYAAITLDPRDSTGLWNAGEVHSMLGQHEEAIAKVEEAVALNPHDAMSRYFLGSVLCRAGRPEEAIPHIDHAMRLSPRDIFVTGMLTHRGFALFDLGRYEEAMDWARRARRSPNPRSMTYALYAAVLAKIGRHDDAREAVNALLAHAPTMSCAKYRNNLFGAPAVMERFADALREAGLPE